MVQQFRKPDALTGMVHLVMLAPSPISIRMQRIWPRDTSRCTIEDENFLVFRIFELRRVTLEKSERIAALSFRGCRRPQRRSWRGSHAAPRDICLRIFGAVAALPPCG
jgi:hypothetical protein